MERRSEDPAGESGRRPDVTEQDLLEKEAGVAESTPTVSVIVPVYNGGEGLHLCLQAIKDSTFSSFELLVVDNGSTDQSVAAAEQYADAVLHCPGPSGPGAARNMGVDHAAAPIVFFIDADVVVKKDVMARVVQDFERFPDLSAVFGSYDDDPAAKNFLSQYKNLLHHFVHQKGNADATTFWGGCGAIRKDIFLRIGGFDTKTYPKPSIEDIELGYRLKHHSYRILLDKEIQATHLKEWRLVSLLRAEIFYRAIPWTQLILDRKGLINDLNLGMTQRVSAGLVGLACLLGILGVFFPIAFLFLFFPLGGILALNKDLFGFFQQRRGTGFTILAFAMHCLYFLYSGIVFCLVWIGRIWKLPQPA